MESGRTTFGKMGTGLVNPRTFFENFALLAESPNGVAKLRELILQLAVAGKLVPQHSHDEPAYELLQQVKDEKERQIHERPSKQIEILPLITKRDILKISIPSSWEWAWLGDLARFIDYRGKTPPKTKDGVKLITAKNVRMGFISENPREFVSEETYVKVMTRGFPTIGDILFTTEAPLGNVAQLLTDERIALAQRVIDLQTFPPLLARYLKVCLMSPLMQQAIVQRATGMTAMGIKASRLKLLPTPIPPLEEQKRIVAKVDELMRLCDELEERQQRKRETRARLNYATLESLNKAASLPPEEFEPASVRLADNFATLYDSTETVGKLRSTILQLAVQGKLVRQDPHDESALILLERIKAETKERSTEILTKNSGRLMLLNSQDVPFELPTGWTWARFLEVGELSRGRSKHRPRNAPELYIDGKYKFIQTGDVARANGVITTFTALYNEKGLAQSRMWPKGTMCITIAANIADSGILGFDACFPDSVVGFIPSKIIGNANYFEYFMRTAKSHLQDFAPSTAQKNINLAILESVLIPLPPLAEQKRIVVRVNQLMSLCNELEAKLRQAEVDSEKLMNAAVRYVLRTITEARNSNGLPTAANI